MSLIKHADAVQTIAGAIRKRQGAYILARGANERAPFALLLGAPGAIKVMGGSVISLGLTKEQIEGLRDQCQRALDESLS